jgi:hypothetical protein
MSESAVFLGEWVITAVSRTQSFNTSDYKPCHWTQSRARSEDLNFVLFFHLHVDLVLFSFFFCISCDRFHIKDSFLGNCISWCTLWTNMLLMWTDSVQITDRKYIVNYSMAVRMSESTVISCSLHHSPRNVVDVRCWRNQTKSIKAHFSGNVSSLWWNFYTSLCMFLRTLLRSV